MIIVKFKGGLGNQLFQYALYKKLMLQGDEVKADISDYVEGIDKRDFWLRDFGFKLEYANESEIKKYYGIKDNFFDIFCRTYRLKKHYYREDEEKFNNQVFNLHDTYLDGYWQNELYFSDYASEIRSELLRAVDRFVEQQHLEMLDRIKKENSIAVHIRRGDYLQKNSIYSNLGESDYYDRAMEYMCDRVENPIFYFFSDDIEWVKKKYGNKNNVIVENSGTKSEIVDLVLMSECKHNIIANSSFSWWGAWINSSNKTIIAPSNWFSTQRSTSIICNQWVKI